MLYEQWLGERRCTSNEEAIANTEGFFCMSSFKALFGWIRKVTEEAGNVHATQRELYRKIKLKFTDIYFCLYHFLRTY